MFDTDSIKLTVKDVKHKLRSIGNEDIFIFKWIFFKNGREVWLNKYF